MIGDATKLVGIWLWAVTLTSTALAGVLGYMAVRR